MFGALGCCKGVARHELIVWYTNLGSSYYPKNVPTSNPQHDGPVLKDDDDISVTASLVIIGNW